MVSKTHGDLFILVLKNITRVVARVVAKMGRAPLILEVGLGVVFVWFHLFSKIGLHGVNP